MREGRIDGSAGGRLHVRQRHRLRGTRRFAPARRRQVCTAPLVLFNAHNISWRKSRNFRPRAQWAKIMRDQFKAKNPKYVDASLPHADGGSTLTAQAAGKITSSARQFRPWPLSLVEPSPCTPTSFDEALALPTESLGANRAAHPAGHRLRVRRAADRRSAGRLVTSITHERN